MNYYSTYHQMKVNFFNLTQHYKSVYGHTTLSHQLTTQAKMIDNMPPWAIGPYRSSIRKYIYPIDIMRTLNTKWRIAEALDRKLEIERNAMSRKWPSIQIDEDACHHLGPDFDLLASLWAKSWPDQVKEIKSLNIETICGQEGGNGTHCICGHVIKGQEAELYSCKALCRRLYGNEDLYLQVVRHFIKSV
jgi:hypothetical protein